MGRSRIQRRVPTATLGFRSCRYTASPSPNGMSGPVTAEDLTIAYTSTSTSTGWSHLMSEDTSHAGHGHPHAPITDGSESPEAGRARALEEPLVEKGVVTL